MKVAIVTSSISRNAGGLFVSVRNLAKKLAVSCTVNVIALDDVFTEEDGRYWFPLETVTCNVLGPAAIGYSKGFSVAINESDADIYHSHGVWMWPGIVAGQVAMKKNKPLIISPRGMLDPWALQNSRWKKKIVGWLFENKNLKSAACLHALCDSECESIRKYGLKNPVAIIPNGIDLPEVKNDMPALWEGQISEDKKVMLFLGRIHPKKGLPNLIKAWARVKPTDWVLAIAGWTQSGHEDELKKTTTELGLEKDVVFPGPVFNEKKKACLQSADAFILPSFSEGLPMSVLEAWVYGLPVIMTKECNIPEGFEVEAAVEIRPEIDSISEGLKSFFALSKEQQEEIGLNGEQLVQDKFTWPKIAAQMIDVYKWVLGHGDKPDCVRPD